MPSKQVVVISSIAGVVVVGLTIFFSVYYTVGAGKKDVAGPSFDDIYFDTVVDAERIDCHPEESPNKDACLERGCFWKRANSDDKAPRCFYPPSYGYNVLEQTATKLGWNAVLGKSGQVQTRGYGAQISTLKAIVERQTEERVHFKIVDAHVDRYEVPKASLDIPAPENQPADTLYDIDYTERPFGLQIKRKDTGSLVFNSSVGGLTYEEQFIQTTIMLPTSHIFGFGEHVHEQLHHDMDWMTWGIFTRNPVFSYGKPWNLYGYQTFFMGIEEDATAFGVVLVNSNGMDVALSPAPAVTFRMIGGVIDFYVFLGPSPENVVQQYLTAIGTPMMPPYWALGFQLSRWEYNSLDKVQRIVEETRAAGIPYDVQYGDIDYMNGTRDWTIDQEHYAGLPEYVDQLHEWGMHYIIIVDPGIKIEPGYPAYDEGLEKDVFVKKPNGVDYAEGVVWPGLCHYPDFTKEATIEWWTKYNKEFRETLAFDAIWIDMNEPANFIYGSPEGCPVNRWNNPPYLSRFWLYETDGGTIWDKTICMDNLQEWGRHYDVHSMYGHSMSIATRRSVDEIFPDKRSMVLTRSAFMSSGHYAGHWTGDNKSEWPALGDSIPSILEMNLFGFPYIGADICGFFYNTTEELCHRWTLVGAFYPFARNHNTRDTIDQHPTVWPAVAVTARDVLLIRYRLLPFLYTLFHHSHTMGSTVLRSLHHEFPLDSNTYTVDRQFLWGPSFLISPATMEGQETVTAYFPEARWYDYHTGKEELVRADTQIITTPIDYIPLHIRGGYVIPVQEPNVTTTISRLNPLGLIVALGDGPEYTAMGDLFWDDGESKETASSGQYTYVQYTVNNGTLNMEVKHSGFPTTLTYDTIEILGLSQAPTPVNVDGAQWLAENMEYDSENKVLTIQNLGLDMMTDHVILWS